MPVTLAEFGIQDFAFPAPTGGTAIEDYFETYRFQWSEAVAPPVTVFVTIMLTNNAQRNIAGVGAAQRNTALTKTVQRNIGLTGDAGANS